MVVSERSQTRKNPKAVLMPIAHKNSWATGAYYTRVMHVPDGPTRFEQLVKKRGLQNRPDLWVYDTRLRAFARRERFEALHTRIFLGRAGVGCGGGVVSTWTMYFVLGLVCGAGVSEGLIKHSPAYFVWGALALFIGICSFDWKKKQP